jgi:hypothetical protein
MQWHYGLILKMFDELCDFLTNQNKNLLIPWFILTSYAYYEEDKPLLSDACFDSLCKRLSQYYFEIDHIHKDLLLDETQGEEIKFHTGHFLKYPERIKYVVEEIRKLSPLDILSITG